jgi:hypothetical protein
LVAPVYKDRIWGLGFRFQGYIHMTRTCTNIYAYILTQRTTYVYVR